MSDEAAAAGVSARVAELRAHADPFSATADPEAYVPRAETERVLQEWQTALDKGVSGLALSGAPGIGKTMLARVLEQRLGERYRFVGLPYAALSMDDLARWVLNALDTAPALEEDHPVARFGRVVRASDLPVVLVIDDANALSSDTARRLSALLRSAEGALRVLALVTEDRHAGRVLAALGPGFQEWRLEAPLGRDELGDYLRARLALANLPEALSDRFTPDVLAWLHRESGGIPRRLHELATRFLIEDETARPAARHREGASWLDVERDDTAEIDEGSELDAAVDPGFESTALAQPAGTGNTGRRLLIAGLVVAAIAAIVATR